MQLLLKEMRVERDARNQAKIEALTEKSNTLIATMNEMKGYIIQLRDFIKKLGHDPPQPPRER